jgi:NAD dependent epimerase/dehydratase family enzyme
LPFRFGLGARLGNGHQYFPWIHVEDAVNIILFAAAEEELQGPVNVVAPEPVTNAEFTSALARAQGHAARLVAPAFALKLALGDMAVEMLLAGQRMSPARVLERGYRFRFDLLADALRDVVGAPSEGRPTPTATTTPTPTPTPTAPPDPTG